MTTDSHARKGVGADQRRRSTEAGCDKAGTAFASRALLRRLYPVQGPVGAADLPDLARID
jgi:hypothetical protein